jgi:oligopeptide/dipeptide ABC transporter ATP-binding protein
MLVEVKNLKSYFFLDEGVLKAVDDLSFCIAEQEAVALVGESGCGKTIVALSLLDLIPSPGRVVDGQMLFDGQDLRTIEPEQMRLIRGRQIGLVFQEPGVALNPVHTVGHQIAEVLRLHRSLTRQEAHTRAVQLLGKVGIDNPEQRAGAYPFELSGGMQQRVLIATAIAGQPKLLIADEPTTALDPTVQAEILDLLRYLQAEYRMSLLLITHDIGVVAEMADRVLVMYTGKIVETGDTKSLFQDPRHPYTQGLLKSVPQLGVGRGEALRGIPGTVPDFLELPRGCTFHPRCAIAGKDCAKVFPPVEEIAPGRQCACYKVT